MGDTSTLKQKTESIVETVLDYIHKDQRILIIGHNDADGIASATLMAKALLHLQARFTLRIFSELSPISLATVKKTEQDFHIFCDLGGGQIKEIRKLFAEKWIIIDHHQVSKDELLDPNVINSWAFNFDGGIDACATTMAYQVASQINRQLRNSSWLPVVASLADLQDQGEKYSLTGLNKNVLDEAKNLGIVKEAVDLIFYGRETKPIHESIATTTTPFIAGLSGNRDACLTALTQSGINLKKNDHWRTISELSDEEKTKVAETVIPYIGGEGKIEDVIGQTYTLQREDEHSHLRDAREFGDVLNACGRMKMPSIGIGLCIGDRRLSLTESEKILLEYRKRISQVVKLVIEDTKYIVEKNSFNFVLGEKIIDEELTGAISSVLSGTPKFSSKPILVSTKTKSNELRISARFGIRYTGKGNLGVSINKIAKKIGGRGGGHKAAAGATIPFKEKDSFINSFEEELANS